MSRTEIKKSKSKPKPSKIGIHSASSARASTNEFVPFFSMEHMRDDYCMTECEHQEQGAFLRKLRMLSRMTWSMIRGASRTGAGFERIANTSMNVPIPSCVPDGGIQSTRFDGRDGRIIGFREDQTFYIVWVDPKLECYDHD